MLALDIGGTRVKAGRVDGGRVEALAVADHDGSWGSARAVARRLVAELRPGGTGTASGVLGLAVPGVTDDGVVSSLADKLDGLVGLDLVRDWADVCDRVVVSNDALAYAVGEAVHGAGRGHDRVVAVTLGTGVGVGVVELGRPLGRGPLSGGLLGGRIPLGDSTFEQCCRAEALGADPGSVLRLARSGSAAALTAVGAVRDALVAGLTALAAAHAPSVLVVGGGPLSTDDLLLDGVEERVQARLWPGHACVVRRAELGDAAALVGLGVLAS